MTKSFKHFWRKTWSWFKGKTRWLWRKIHTLLKTVMRWIKNNPLIFILVVFLLFIGILSILRMCDMSGMGHYLDRLLGTSDKYKTLRTFGLTIFGIGALIGLAVAYLRVEAAFQSNRDMIYNNAITHLGHKEASVRLGGAYALYELSELEPNRLKNIAEILCAHVRETTQDKDYVLNNKKKPSNEIQSLLNILSNLNAIYQEKESRRLLDLSSAYLNGASLLLKNLQRADLSEAQMQGALLSRALMQTASLYRTQMQGAILENAQMQGAFLYLAQMQGAYLRSAQMQGADLENAQMQGANLANAQMQGADLLGVQMQGADLHNTNIAGAFAIEDKTHGLSFLSFKERIKERRNKNTKLKAVIWSGEKNVGDMERLEKHLRNLVQEGKLAKTFADNIIQKISPHKGKPPKYKPIPKEVVTGKLINKMADEIIKDYEKP